MTDAGLSIYTTSTIYICFFYITDLFHCMYILHTDTHNYVDYSYINRAHPNDPWNVNVKIKNKIKLQYVATCWSWKYWIS